jgi:hypothetical protein
MRLGEFDASLRKCLLIGLLSYVVAFGFIGGSIGYRERGFVRGLQGLSVGAVVGLPLGLGAGFYFWLREGKR